ncbi:MAG: IS630 transposase-related protein [Planctomycetota bacterium]
MPAAYSQDLRDRVLAAAARGMPAKQIAETFVVSPAWVHRLKQRRRETGETAPRKAGSPGVPRIERGVLAALVAEQPDATDPELRDRLAERTGVRVTDTAIYMMLKKLGLTFKKRRSMRPSRTAPMSPSSARGGVTSSPIATPAG